MRKWCRKWKAYYESEIWKIIRRFRFFFSFEFRLSGRERWECHRDGLVSYRTQIIMPTIGGRVGLSLSFSCHQRWYRSNTSDQPPTLAGHWHSIQIARACATPARFFPIPINRIRCGAGGCVPRLEMQSEPASLYLLLAHSSLSILYGSGFWSVWLFNRCSRAKNAIR